MADRPPSRLTVSVSVLVPPLQTDHTAYTLTTAGSDGFLNLMPIYIDHILYPTLSTASESHRLRARDTTWLTMSQPCTCARRLYD